MESTLKRAWAEIDLDALAHNYHVLRARIGPASRFMGVVKADAYGHGAAQVSRTLEELGAEIHRTDREGTVTVRVKDGRVGIH